MRNSPRILCIIDTIGRGGGAEQLLRALLPALRQKAVDIEVAALFDWHDELADELQASGIVVHRLRIAGPRSLASGLWRIAKLARRGRYDIYWGHLLLGNLYARMAQLLSGSGKVVATLHSKELPGAQARGRPSIGRRLERRLLAGAQGKVAVSDALRADYRRAFGWNDIAVIHNGIDVGRVRALANAADRRPVRAAYGAGESDLLLVTPARFVPVKGHSFLLQALAELVAEGVAVTLVLCGEGPLEGALKTEVKRCGLDDHVRFTGLLNHEQLIPLMAAADAVVLPSLYESFGLVPVESLAAGTPVIVTRVDGFSEVLGDRAGVTMVDAGSGPSLAAAIRALSDNRDRAGSRAIEPPWQHDVHARASEWLSLFSALE